MERDRTVPGDARRALVRVAAGAALVALALLSAPPALAVGGSGHLDPVEAALIARRAELEAVGDRTSRRAASQIGKALRILGKGSLVKTASREIKGASKVAKIIERKLPNEAGLAALIDTAADGYSGDVTAARDRLSVTAGLPALRPKQAKKLRRDLTRADKALAAAGDAPSITKRLAKLSGAAKSARSFPKLPITKITILDFMADASGNTLYGREDRWASHDLEFHGEGVAQSAVYGFDLMSDAAGVAALVMGTPYVEIVRWSNAAHSDAEWLANAKDCFTTMYAEGSRIFNVSFGSNATEVPEFDGWLADFAREKEAAGDPIVVTIGSGNDPRNTSTFDVTPPRFGGLHFFPNLLATNENSFFVQVGGIEDNLDAVRWCGYESTFDNGWKVDLEASIKLWDFDENGDPYWWRGRVGTSFSCAVVAGVLGYVQAHLRYHGQDPDMYEIRDLLLNEAITAPFKVKRRRFEFPVVETHANDEYTNWDEVPPYALDPSQGIVMQFDDATDAFVFGPGPSVTREMRRRGLVAPQNAKTILKAVERAAHAKP